MVMAGGGSTEFVIRSDTEVSFTRVVAAPITLVWDCWTRPEHLRQWLLGPPGWTMTVCEHELKPGSPWRKAWRKADGEVMELKGVITEVTPPRRLVQTESWGEPWPETVNTLELSEQGGRTTITVTVRYPSKQARDAALQTGMREGMEMGWARLDELLLSLTRDR